MPMAAFTVGLTEGSLPERMKLTMSRKVSVSIDDCEQTSPMVMLPNPRGIEKRLRIGMMLKSRSTRLTMVSAEEMGCCGLRDCIGREGMELGERIGKG